MPGQQQPPSSLQRPQEIQVQLLSCEHYQAAIAAAPAAGMSGVGGGAVVVVAVVLGNRRESYWRKALLQVG